MLKWISKNKPIIDINTVAPSIVDVSNILNGLTSLDIKTHIQGQSISAWKNNQRIFTWDLSQITDLQKSNNKITVLSDDYEPVTLIFVNNLECELALEKFNNAGNGQTV